MTENIPLRCSVPPETSTGTILGRQMPIDKGLSGIITKRKTRQLATKPEGVLHGCGASDNRNTDASTNHMPSTKVQRRILHYHPDTCSMSQLLLLLWRRCAWLREQVLRIIMRLCVRENTVRTKTNAQKQLKDVFSCGQFPTSLTPLALNQSQRSSRAKNRNPSHHIFLPRHSHIQHATILVEALSSYN